MRQRPVLTTEDAKRMMAAAETCASQHQLPVTIAIADEAGDPLLLVRMEGVRGQTSELAIAKARCAATSHRATAFWAERIKDMPGFNAFPHMCALAGGVPIVHEDMVIGAVGVSGAKGKGEDDLVAAAAIAAL
jgi:glc operon protein GlcG